MNSFSTKIASFLTCVLIFAGVLFWGSSALAQLGLGSQPTNVVLQSWSFSDPTSWRDDAGYEPVSFTNLAYSNLGYGQTLVVDTNIPAWLRYNVVESDQTTNLTVNFGTVIFWFAPGSWSSTNAGGDGPGEFGRLLEAGSYTPNSSYGLWSIHVDSGGNNLYFSAQTNDLSSNLTTYVCAPISWTTNFFHCIALSYSATNTTLYQDGVEVTSGPGVTVYPGPNVLTKGFCIGSDTNGVYQAHGLFDLVQTYNYPLDSNDVQTIFNWYYPNFAIDPNNIQYMDNASLSSFSLSTTNLAISPLTFSNNTASLFVVNSTADILYEVQGCTNLAQRNWFTEGFVVGSELTNWTWANFYVSKKGDLFLRIRSWQNSDDSGLPIWWESEYFGTNVVNSDAQDSAGDGWTIYQKFEMGINPSQFVTPPTPQGVMVNYDANTATATINWLPSPGSVTSYTVQKIYIPTSDGYTPAQTNYFSSTTTSYTDNVSANQPNSWANGTITVTYSVRANYAGGDSVWSAAVPLEASNFAARIGGGAQGTAILVVSAMPPNTTEIQLTELNETPLSDGYSGVVTNIAIAISQFINNYCALPDVQTTASGFCEWVAQAVGSNGRVSASCVVSDSPFEDSLYSPETNWIVAPFYDERAELKQNLIFQLRAATVNMPLSFAIGSSPFYGIGSFGAFYGQCDYPTNYAYAGFFQFANSSLKSMNLYGAFDVYLPFEENYLFRNLVFSAADVDANGVFTNATSSSSESPIVLNNSPKYQFQTEANGTVFPDVLTTNNMAWLFYDAYEGGNPVDWDGLISLEGDGSTYYDISLLGNARNWFGLPYVAANVVYQLFDINSGNAVGLQTNILLAGSTLSYSAAANSSAFFSADGDQNIYFDTAQPKFQTAEYDFWNANTVYNTASQTYTYPVLPGNTAFSPTNHGQLLLTTIGNNNFQVAGYAKLEVTNSAYSGVYGYLAQYFTNAFEIDTNGNVTTNVAGVLSPYGNFLATYPGAVALVTMPDIDTGQQGTDVVYAISLGLDANHDGNMDLSFNGTDVTSTNSPFVFWVNNNYDRFVLDTDDGVFYDDDVASTTDAAGCPYTPNTPTPDCNYLDGSGHRVIPCARDLQDFARLWVCGISSNLLAGLPAGSTVTLNWGDVGSPNPANPTIDLFTAADADGGIGYLTNSDIAGTQTDPLFSPYVGRIRPGSDLVLNASTFANYWAGNYFIWCGVSNGTGGLNLTIMDASSNVLAQTTAYIQIGDIKQMYERWTVGEQPTTAPTTNAIPSTEGLTADETEFVYPQPQNTNTAYILYVHGWNMQPWEKDRFAESAFKRLYWQGYQGRFGQFRWPTDNGFTGSYWQALSDPDNYDNSENHSWQSAQGLMNLLHGLNVEYPGHVYVLAHSMGNVVTGEALRLAAQNGDGKIVNKYVASQAALSAHNYDKTVTTPYLLPFTYKYPSGFISTLGTNNYGPYAPDIYGNRLTNHVASVGQMFSYYNANDFALVMPRWGFDQILKPDHSVVGGYYAYSGSVNDPAPWNNFEFVFSGGTPTTYFDIVNSLNDRYEVMAYAAPSYSTALGATPGITNVVNLNLTTVWPPDLTGNNFTEHFYHSAEFRGDCWQEWNYWNTLLYSSPFGFNIGPQ
jgi:hypothetical protein